MLATLYLDNENFTAKAIEYLDEAIALRPRSADLHNLRGVAYSKAGDGAALTLVRLHYEGRDNGAAGSTFRSHSANGFALLSQVSALSRIRASLTKPSATHCSARRLARYHQWLRVPSRDGEADARAR